MRKTILPFALPGEQFLAVLTRSLREGDMFRRVGAALILQRH